MDTETVKIIHNRYIRPAVVNADNMPTVDSSLCVACGACAEVCPQDAITIEDVSVIDASKCVDCGACVDECPAGAISD